MHVRLETIKKFANAKKIETRLYVITATRTEDKYDEFVLLPEHAKYLRTFLEL